MRVRIQEGAESLGIHKIGPILKQFDSWLYFLKVNNTKERRRDRFEFEWWIHVVDGWYKKNEPSKSCTTDEYGKSSFHGTERWSEYKLFIPHVDGGFHAEKVDLVVACDPL